MLKDSLPQTLGQADDTTLGSRSRFTKDFNPSCTKLLVASWKNVGKATVVNYFRKAKISVENQVDALEDSDDPFKALQVDGLEDSNDPFKALQENLTKLRQSNPDLVLMN